MNFGDKVYALRREKGLSQEQLAELLSITRQSVSKWESGGAMPELDKLIAVSDLFGVSVDYLVRDNAAREEQAKNVATAVDNVAVMEQLSEIKQSIKKRDGYEYKSKATWLGLPLVHVCFSRGGGFPRAAKGVIAIGNVAVGLISLGGICVGLLSFGGVAIGLIALGALVIGGLVCGGVGIGAVALGGIAIGIYAVGGTVLARELAIGGIATGKVAVGRIVDAQYALQMNGNVTRKDVWQFILHHYPKLWEGFLRLIA